MKEMGRDFYICSISELCVRTPAPVETVYIDSVLGPLHCLDKELNSLGSGDDSNALLTAVERVHVVPIADSWEDSFSFRYT